MPATRTSSARPSTAHAESEPYPAQPGPFARTDGATWPATSAYARAQSDGATEDHTPNHCSAPYSSNRCTSVNPQLRRKAHRAVVGGLGAQHHRSLGSAPSNQSSVPTQASAARTRVPTPPAGTCSRARPLPGIRKDVTRTFCVAPVERDRPDHRSVEIDHEKARAQAAA